MEKLEITKVNKNELMVINFEEIKEYLNNFLQEINLDDAEKEKAKLNKLKTSLENERKRIKQEVMEQYNLIFEPQMKELTSLIDNTLGTLNQRIEAKKEAYEREKELVVKEMWKELNFDLITLDRIFNPKWLNKTYTEKQIQDDMISFINQIKQDLITLDTLENKEDLKTKYLLCLNLNETIRLYNAEKQAKSRLYQTKDTETIEIPKELKKRSITLKITGTKEQLFKLNDYLQKEFLEWEQINEK